MHKTAKTNNPAPNGGGGKRACTGPRPNSKQNTKKAFTKLSTAVQASGQPSEFAPAGLAGLVPQHAVGIIGRRNHRGIVRHQPHPSLNNGKSTTDGPPLYVLHGPRSGTVVVTAPGTH